MSEAAEWVKAAEMSKKYALDSEEASAVVSRLRSTFDSGKTRSYRWRASQLEALITLADQNQHLIVQALHSDLSKPETEAFIHENTYRRYPFFLDMKVIINAMQVLAAQAPPIGDWFHAQYI